MSGNYFEPDWVAKVSVPVKRVGDRWEFFYGGDVPVRDGTLGELTVNAQQITDDRFRQRVTQELTVRILEEGTPLLIALSDRSANGAPIGKWPDPSPLSVPVGTTRFERVVLGPPRKVRVPGAYPAEDSSERGGLFIKLKGLEKCELHGSTVRMPKEFAAPAVSLNHAVTMLSQAYEKHRISNTGNVYTRVFYQDHDDHWYPLDDLRAGVHVIGERKLLGDLWAEIEQKLGWRPAPSPEKRRRRNK